MAKNLSLGQTVFIPSFLLPGGGKDRPYSIFETKVVEVEERSVKVQLPNGDPSEFIATSKIHENIGIAIISIGDFQSEETLIDPLSKSILQFCRLLLPDDQVVQLKTRSIGELGEWWKKSNAAFTHIVFIGHGSKQGITFGFGGERTATLFKRRLVGDEVTKKTFISLCCETGQRPFASEFSSLSFCNFFIAPEGSLHGAIASQFFQTFLSLHLLQAKSLTIAFRSAIETLPSKEKFCLWENGKLTKKSKGKSSKKKNPELNHL